MLRFSYENAQTSDFPAPEAYIRLSNPVDSTKTTSLLGIVDSGATITCVPESKIANLGANLEYEFIEVYDANGNCCERKIYSVNLFLEDQAFEELQVIALPKSVALIGRDILNRKKVMLDASKDIWIYGCLENCPLEEISK